MKKIIAVSSLLVIGMISVVSAQTEEFTFNLRAGATGQNVVKLQEFLIKEGYDIPSISKGWVKKGYFGLQTRQAVIKYQLANKLPGTGFFGPLTRAKANSVNSQPGGNVQRGESLMLLMPNEAVSLEQGTKYTITWTGSPGILGTSTGSLWLAYTPSCLLITSSTSPVCALAQPAPTLISDSIKLADKVYVWSVPNFGNPVSFFKVMICKGKSQSCDESDNYFSIGTSSTPFVTSLKLESPNGGETLRMGTSYDVRWSSSNVSRDVSLRLVSNSANYMCKKANGTICPMDASTVVEIASGIPNNGSYSWLIATSTPLLYTDNVTDSHWGEYWFQVCAGAVCDDSDSLVKVVR